MKTINSERIKSIKATLRRLNEVLSNYKAMEEAQDKSRNTITYDAAGEHMKFDYYMIIAEMNKMLNEVDILGINCGALGVKEYNKIEKHTINA